MNLSILVLFIVLVLIAFRAFSPVKLAIWQIMLGGALVVLFTGQIEPLTAVQAINRDVMFFLFGVFVIGQAMEESGHLGHLSYKIFSQVTTIDGLLLSILFVMGTLSALLMNDTLAIIGTPIALHLASQHRLPPKALLLCLAFAVTIGSVASPIGNPQNLIISLQGDIPNPFIVFLKFLGISTFINLIVAFILIKFFFRKQFHSSPLTHSIQPIKDKNLANLCKASLVALALLILVKIISVSFNAFENFKLTHIALLSAIPILALSPKRLQVVRQIDWHTLVFFASMFILMKSVWNSNLFIDLLNNSSADLNSIPAILGISVSLSQLISNVPMVALYLPILSEGGVMTDQLVALAAGSTLAGNLFIIGAASNVIIIQKAEKISGETLGFFEFAKIGLPLTIINVGVCWVFI
jgi:Na+/H+ antiporter NhaD/arsenite permease-like protein